MNDVSSTTLPVLRSVEESVVRGWLKCGKYLCKLQPTITPVQLLEALDCPAMDAAIHLNIDVENGTTASLFKTLEENLKSKTPFAILVERLLSTHQ